MRITKYVERPLTLTKILQKMTEMGEDIDFYFDVNIIITDQEVEQILEILQTDYFNENDHIDACIYLQIGHLVTGRRYSNEEIVNSGIFRRKVNQLIYLLGDILNMLEKNCIDMGMYNNLRCEENMIFYKLMYTYMLEFSRSRNTKSARSC